MMKCCI